MFHLDSHPGLIFLHNRHSDQFYLLFDEMDPERVCLPSTNPNHRTFRLFKLISSGRGTALEFESMLHIRDGSFPLEGVYGCTSIYMAAINPANLDEALVLTFDEEHDPITVRLSLV